MIAQAGQIPSGSELSNNRSLDAPVTRNHEVGIKGRGAAWQFDASVYAMSVRDEIVQQNNGGVTDYVNAGRTDKKGAELDKATKGVLSLVVTWPASAVAEFASWTAAILK